ncbi:MAG: biotin/lipoyl-binding protein, partial [Selenomonadaceae bacterium]|nr:biotin/lipoyl-binding protein [Selenomonadaceae bacterium]
MISTHTIDISNKISRYIKFSLVGLLAIASAVGGGIFYFQHVEDTMTINNAKLAGTLVSVRVLTDGKIHDLTHADGDQVKAGDVLANLEVSVTDEQIAQLEQAVDLAKDNYAQLQQGQMVKVEVRTPRPKTVVRQQPAQQYEVAAPSANLSVLAERKERMEKLYEMGAISRVQRDAAVQEYEAAQIEASTPHYEEYTPEPIYETEMEYVTE